MKIYYSSMYIVDKMECLEDCIKKIKPENITLYLDTNLCIYLRDFYREPHKIVYRNDDTWNELKNLLYYINKYDINVDYNLGAEESCRNKSNFEINLDKLKEMYQGLLNIFDMDYLEILEHGKLIKFKAPSKDITEKIDTKLNSLEQNSIFQKILFLTYGCILKLFILEESQNDKLRHELMLEYIDFLDKDIDLIGTSTLLFGHYYLSGDTHFKKIIHKSKNIVNEKLDSFWNAAIDLTLPTIISSKYGEDNKVPIFATSDERFWGFFNLQKVRVLITENNIIKTPPFIEMDLSGAKWTDDELYIIDSYFSKVLANRKNKVINRTIAKAVSDKSSIEYEYKILNKLRTICYNLEQETKNIINVNNTDATNFHTY